MLRTRVKKLLFLTLIILIGVVFPLSYVEQVYAQDEAEDEITIGYYDEETNDNTEINLNLFNVGAWGRIDEIGMLSALGLIAQFIFVFLIVIWVFLAIFAGLKIIRSQGDPEGIKGGMTRIQNMLAGITIGLLFFVAVSFIGEFAGVGNVFDWSENLQECSCENASGGDCYTYLFQAKASREDGDSIEWICGGQDEHDYYTGNGWHK